jgi:HEAT repeat protein
MYPFVSTCVLTFCLAAAAPQPARDRAAATAQSPSSDVSAMAAGWKAFADGRTDDAVKQADAILARRAWDRGALTLKISALAAAAPARALAAYEMWIAGGHTDDAGLLEPVAISVLQEIAAGGNTELRPSALRALAGARVQGAQKSLDALAAGPGHELERDLAAARSGDAAALQRLSAEASRPEGGSPALAQALGEAGLGGEAGLIVLLKSNNPQTRAASAEALGTMKSEHAAAALQGLMRDPDPAVRAAATVSLAQLGDTTALATVDRMLASDVPDAQIAAARAWSGRPGPWVAVVRALLDNQDGLTRLEAARAIAPVDPEAAQRVLTGALGDPNPVIRYESAKAIDIMLDLPSASANVASLRQRLGDRDAAVRLPAASALLKLARK